MVILSFKISTPLGDVGIKVDTIDSVLLKQKIKDNINRTVLPYFPDEEKIKSKIILKNEYNTKIYVNSSSSLEMMLDLISKIREENTLDELEEVFDNLTKLTTKPFVIFTAIPQVIGELIKIVEQQRNEFNLMKNTQFYKLYLSELGKDFLKEMNKILKIEEPEHSFYYLYEKIKPNNLLIAKAKLIMSMFNAYKETPRKIDERITELCKIIAKTNIKKEYIDFALSEALGYDQRHIFNEIMSNSKFKEMADEIRKQQEKFEEIEEFSDKSISNKSISKIFDDEFHRFLDGIEWSAEVNLHALTKNSFLEKITGYKILPAYRLVERIETEDGSITNTSPKPYLKININPTKNPLTLVHKLVKVFKKIPAKVKIYSFKLNEYNTIIKVKVSNNEIARLRNKQNIISSTMLCPQLQRAFAKISSSSNSYHYWILISDDITLHNVPSTIWLNPQLLELVTTLKALILFLEIQDDKRLKEFTQEIIKTVKNKIEETQDLISDDHIENVMMISKKLAQEEPNTAYRKLINNIKNETIANIKQNFTEKIPNFIIDVK